MGIYKKNKDKKVLLPLEEFNKAGKKKLNKLLDKNKGNKNRKTLFKNLITESEKNSIQIVLFKYFGKYREKEGNELYNEFYKK